jgi:hypothetical protein
MVDAIAAWIPGPQREQRVAWLARNASTQAHNPNGPTLNYAPVREKTRGPMMTGEPDRFTIVVAYTAWMKKRYARIDLVPDAILIDDNDQHTTVPCNQILIVQINVREGHDDRLALFLRDGSILEVLRGRELFMVQRVLSDYLDLPRPSWEQRQRLWAHE